MNNLTLRSAAIAGITDKGYEAAPGYCERFFRQVSESVYGTTYADYYCASARETALAFLDGGQQDYSAFVATSSEHPQLGDVFFKTQGSGNFGHVGIYVGDIAGIGADLVAENSSTSIGRINGAKGYRTLNQWGHIDVVVRFPDPHLSPRLIIARTGTSGQWIYSASYTARHDPATGHFTINEAELAGILACDGAGRAVREPIRYALNKLGFMVLSINDLMGDPDDPRMYVFTSKG
jgi:hypothetical protein